MRSDIVPGGIFPNYELPDHTGKLRRLSELQGEDPLILTLIRNSCSRAYRACGLERDDLCHRPGEQGLGIRCGVW